MSEPILPTSNLKSLRDAMTEWDSLQDAREAMTRESISFGQLLTLRGNTMDRIIKAARIALSGDSPSCGFGEPRPSPVETKPDAQRYSGPGYALHCIAEAAKAHPQLDREQGLLLIETIKGICDGILSGRSSEETKAEPTGLCSAHREPTDPNCPTCFPQKAGVKPCPSCFGDKTICMSDGSKRSCEYCGGTGVEPSQNGKE